MNNNNIKETSNDKIAAARENIRAFGQHYNYDVSYLEELMDASPGAFLAFEGAAPLAERPEALNDWVARGLRSVGLVHTRNNALATSSGDSDGGVGLTTAGADLVRRAGALGVPVDVSHASDRATRDVLSLARESGVPVIATHSNARAVTDARRNLADAEIRAIAESGGVVGVNFHSRFLVKGRRATIDDVVRQIQYLVRLVGVEHVRVDRGEILRREFGHAAPPR